MDAGPAREVPLARPAEQEVAKPMTRPTAAEPMTPVHRPQWGQVFPLLPLERSRGPLLEPGEGPLVSVLMPTRNAGPLLERVLAALFRQRTSFPFEVIVVDSGSTDETPDILARFPVTVHEIDPAEFNHGATRNLLASLARGDYLVFLTQDAVPYDESWMQHLVAPLVAREALGAYSRQVPRSTTDPINRFFLGELYPDEGRVKALDREAGASLDDIHFSNAASAMTRAAWLEFPFRNDIVMAEDQDWSVRVMRAGHRICYVAHALVEHAHHYTLRETFKRYFDSGASYRDIEARAVPRASFSRQFLSQGVLHVVRMTAHLWRAGDGKWIPRAWIEALVKGAALFLGKHHVLIPTALKVRWSCHAYHWRAAGMSGRRKIALPGGTPGSGGAPTEDFLVQR